MFPVLLQATAYYAEVKGVLSDWDDDRPAVNGVLLTDGEQLLGKALDGTVLSQNILVKRLQDAADAIWLPKDSALRVLPLVDAQTNQWQALLVQLPSSSMSLKAPGDNAHDIAGEQMAALARHWSRVTGAECQLVQDRELERPAGYLALSLWLYKKVASTQVDPSIALDDTQLKALAKLRTVLPGATLNDATPTAPGTPSKPRI